MVVVLLVLFPIVGYRVGAEMNASDCVLRIQRLFACSFSHTHWKCLGAETNASTHSSRIQRLFIRLPPPIHRESRDCSLDFLTPSCLQRDTGTDQDPRRPWEGTLYLTPHCRRQNDFPALRLALMLHSLCGQISVHDPCLF